MQSKMKFKILEIEDIQMYDYPDFCDAYASDAEVWDEKLNDWREATEAELDTINDYHPGAINEMIHNEQLYF